LKAALGLGPDTLHPYIDSTREGQFLKRNIFDTLIYTDPETLALGPGLAESWRERDVLTVDFVLREGATFHDGTPVTTRDVAWTLNHVAAEGARLRYAGASRLAWIARAEALNEREVRVVSARPTPSRLVRLAWMPIMSEQAFAALGRDGMASRPVGSGPYSVELYEHGRRVVLRRHLDYVGPKAGATIDKVEVRIVPSAETRVAELISGDLDWDFGLSMDQVRALRTMPHLQVIDAPTFRVGALQIDAAGRAGQSALTVKRVRQAIAHAVDRAGIVRHLWQQPESSVLNSFCAPGTLGCSQDVAPTYAYDPDRARALLREAGFADGFRTELATSSDRPDVAVIAANLAEVGIRARVQIYPTPTLNRLRDAGRLQMLYVGFGGSQLGDIIDGVYDYNYTFGPRDLARDPFVRDRVNVALESVNPADRAAIVAELEPYLAEQMYTLPINVWDRPYVMSRRLSWAPSPDELPALYLARLEAA
jgi:peptide/nickel transport system substrate-binding protein